MRVALSMQGLFSQPQDLAAASKLGDEAARAMNRREPEGERTAFADRRLMMEVIAVAASDQSDLKRS